MLGIPTCQIHILSCLSRGRSSLDELLQTFVVDVSCRPLGDLISGQTVDVVSEGIKLGTEQKLHTCVRTSSWIVKPTVYLLPSRTFQALAVPNSMQLYAIQCISRISCIFCLDQNSSITSQAIAELLYCYSETIPYPCG